MWVAGGGRLREMIGGGVDATRKSHLATTIRPRALHGKMAISMIPWPNLLVRPGARRRMSRSVAGRRLPDGLPSKDCAARVFRKPQAG